MVTLVSSWKNFRLLETLLRRVLWFPSTSKEWGEWLMLFLSLLVQRKVTLLTGKNTARYVQNIFKLKKLHFLTSIFANLDCHGLPTPAIFSTIIFFCLKQLWYSIMFCTGNQVLWTRGDELFAYILYLESAFSWKFNLELELFSYLFCVCNKTCSS